MGRGAVAVGSSGAAPGSPYRPLTQFTDHTDAFMCWQASLTGGAVNEAVCLVYNRWLGEAARPMPGIAPVSHAAAENALLHD